MKDKKKIKKELNLDIAGKVTELETLLRKVLPRNIIWKIVMGKGLEFDGYRDYTSGDDSSLIDWKATARAQKPLVKKYIEERDLKYMFLIDVSDNMIFSSTEKLKCEYAAELAAALSHLIVTSGDRVGFAMYNDKIVRYKRPDVGNRLFDVLIYELSNPENYGGPSNLNNIIDELLKTLDRTTSMVFIISDFIRLDENYRKNLELLGNVFETVAIILRDPLDSSLPAMNKEVVIEDPESGERLLVNPKVARNIYEKNALEQLTFVKKMFKDHNIDFLELSTKDSFPEKVTEFIKERVKGGRIVKLKNVF